MFKSFKLHVAIGLALSQLMAHQWTYANERCVELLASKLDGTDGLIAYLGSLLERQIIGDSELLRLITGLEGNVLQNPIHEEQAWTSSAALIHREEIQRYFRETEINHEQLLNWSNHSLTEKQRVRVRREETRSDTQSTHQKAEFHPVPAGQFQMLHDPYKVEVSLTHPFEMMSTDVTQAMWVEEMGLNPSNFSDGEHAIEVSINGKSVKMQPDHPVERVSWWSAVEYANRKSVKMKLNPAYDLSHIQWEAGTSAEAGTLAPASVEEAKKLKISAPNEDIYQAEGFRLPTEAEWEYMLRNLGQSSGKYPHDIIEADLADYCWCLSNAALKPHPVATTAKWFQINGKDYYDLVGNVWKWMHDRYQDVQLVKGGVDPQGALTLNSGRVIRGGSFSNDYVFLQAHMRNYHRPDGSTIRIGFRLVRTLK